MHEFDAAKVQTYFRTAKLLGWSIREQFQGSLTSYGKTVMDAVQKYVIGERKFRLMQQRDMEELGDDLRREKYLRQQ